ncbi:MAG: DUF1127 domain-containing protein [Sulfitobacter sp.]
MTVNSHAVGSGNRNFSAMGVVSGIATTLEGFFSKALTNAGSGLKAVQTARMKSTLSDMSDHQLVQIGISRSEIHKYAESLMSGE